MSDLAQSLESAHYDSSVESRTLEAGVAVVSADSGIVSRSIVGSCTMARQHSPRGAWSVEGIDNWVQGSLCSVG